MCYVHTLDAKRSAIEVQNDFNYVCQHFILYVQMDQLSRNLEQFPLSVLSFTSVKKRSCFINSRSRLNSVYALEVGNDFRH